MSFILGFCFVVGLIIAALAGPPAVREKSWLRFFIAAGLVVVGVLLPLVVFLLSFALTPESKSLCPHGWLDCFYMGKLALTPLVLWATTALYLTEIWRIKKLTHPAIVLGWLTGAVVSGGCLLVGIYIQNEWYGLMYLWLFVPLYIWVWYSCRALQLICRAKTTFLAGWATLAASVPFWLASMVWAKKTYLALPDEQYGCFVVTAAMRGHEAVVGPCYEIQHAGQIRRVNRQLRTFWQLETAWKCQAPRSHAWFRCVYNRVGPMVARRIRSPWLADLAFVGLKPAEWGATLWLHTQKNRRY